mmetsp:Transcript_69289/g.216325  ORF Transcript_69289/g.216325 Transcript_69289/m.216325 type:complete len:357 (+) Transcript_69289:62-1132(+)
MSLGLPHHNVEGMGYQSEAIVQHAQQQQQQPANSGSGSARGACVHRPPEPPRAASSAPRGAVSPSRLGHAHSTGNLGQRPRAASVDPSPEEAPPRGCVADKVTMFERRCQTPRRDVSEMHRLRSTPRSEPRDVRPGRTSREDRPAWAAPPALPRAGGSVPSLGSLVPSMPPPAQQPAVATMPAVGAMSPAQVSGSSGQSRNHLQVPTAAPQPGGPSPSIQAMAAHFQARASPEQLLSGRPGTRSLRGLELQTDDEDDAAAEQVDMGMSPISRPQPQEDALGQPSVASATHEPAMAPTLQAPASVLDARVMGVGPIGGASVVSVSSSGMSAWSQAQSREPSVPEISVLERIRKLEVR